MKKDAAKRGKKLARQAHRIEGGVDSYPLCTSLLIKGGLIDGDMLPVILDIVRQQNNHSGLQLRLTICK